MRVPRLSLTPLLSVPRIVLRTSCVQATGAQQGKHGKRGTGTSPQRPVIRAGSLEEARQRVR